MKKKLLLAALAVSALGAATAAQSAEDSGFYIGGGIGRATLSGDMNFNVNGERPKLDDWDTAWRAIAGYQLNKYLALQVEYIDTGTQEQHLTGGIGLAMDAQTTNTVASVIGILPITDSFSVYGKVGYDFYNADFQIIGRERVPPANVAVREFLRIERKESGEELLYGAGVRFTRDAFTFNLQYEIVDVDFEAKLFNERLGSNWDLNLISISTTYKF